MITNTNFLTTLQEFRFRDEKKLTDNFIKSLQKNDMFSFHCRDFVEYLKFKKCDKHFRLAFNDWLLNNKIQYFVSNEPLTKYKINNFLNAEKIVATEYKDFCQTLAKCNENNLMYNDISDIMIDIVKRQSTLIINMDKQKLNASFMGGCWLTLLKND